MSAYRFCRTDDIPLLVRAYNECLAPRLPELPPYSAADLKRDIRELGLWCSSCMVALEGDRPVGIMLGCKRPPETFVHTIAVHPDHLRQGHARHLLTSLSAKLAILGPPRLVTEVPAGGTAARALFEACGWREEMRFVDLVLELPPAAAATAAQDAIVLPVTPADLGDGALPPEGAPRAWERSRATLSARRDRLSGLALVAGERIVASLIHADDEPGPISVWNVVASEDDEGLSAVGVLLADLRARRAGPIFIPRLGADEAQASRLELLGFRRTAETVRYVSAARPA